MIQLIIESLPKEVKKKARTTLVTVLKYKLEKDIFMYADNKVKDQLNQKELRGLSNIEVDQQRALNGTNQLSQGSRTYFSKI